MSIEPKILDNIEMNNNLYTNLYLYEAYHDFSKARGNIGSVSTDKIKKYIGLYSDTPSFPIANDEDRFIEDIDNGKIYNIDGTITNITPITYNIYQTSIENLNKYRYEIDNKLYLEGEIESVLNNNDIIEVYFNYYKENKGKWLKLDTVKTLKALITHIFTVSSNDRHMRFLVDTCKLNLAMIYYNTETIKNEFVYQIVDETNKWDMASTRKNPYQITGCLAIDPMPLDLIDKQVTLSIPISYTKNKKEFRKISYNLISENLLEPIALSIRIPTEKIDSSLDYLYTSLSGSNKDYKTILSSQYNCITVPTNTPNIVILLANIVYKDSSRSECFSTTILLNTANKHMVLLLNPYAFGKSNKDNKKTSIEEELDDTNISGIFSVNEIKDLMDNTSREVYKNLTKIHVNNMATYNKLLFDIKRSGDWSQILAIYKTKDKMNNVFITIDRLAFEYAKLLKVPAILTSKDFGSDTYRFTIYHDRLVRLKPEDRKKLKDQQEKDILEKELKMYIESVRKEYEQKHSLIITIWEKLKHRNFSNNISEVEEIVNNGKAFTNRLYIDKFIKAIFGLYKKIINVNFSSIKNTLEHIIIPPKKNTLGSMEIDIPLLSNSIEKIDQVLSIQEYLYSKSDVPDKIFHFNIKNNDKLQWLIKVLKECIAFPRETGYILSILENLDKLFIGTTVRKFKINEENIVYITQAINSLITIVDKKYLLVIPKKLDFTPATLENWFSESTKNIDSVVITSSRSTIQLAKKPIHFAMKIDSSKTGKKLDTIYTRNTRSNRQNGGMIPENYKYFIPKPFKNGKEIEVNHIVEFYKIADEYIGRLAIDPTKNIITSGFDKISFAGDQEKSMNSIGFTYISGLFDPTFLDLLKIYIRFSIDILGLVTDNIDSELAEEEVSTQKKLKYIYGYFYKDSEANLKPHTNNQVDFSEYSNPMNISNSYLDLLENSTREIDITTSTINIENIIEKLEIDVNNASLSDSNKLIYWYLISLAISELSIVKDGYSIEEQLVIEPFENFYNDLDQIIYQLKNAENDKSNYYGGGYTDIIDSLYEEPMVRNYHRNNSEVAIELAQDTNYKINALNYLAKTYIREISSYINKLNNYYIRIIINNPDPNTLATYINLASTLYSSYTNLNKLYMLYLSDYIFMREYIDKTQIEISKLIIYHDSELSTIPYAFSHIEKKIDPKYERNINNHITYILNQLEKNQYDINDVFAEYLEFLISQLDPSRIKYFNKDDIADN